MWREAQHLETEEAGLIRRCFKVDPSGLLQEIVNPMEVARRVMVSVSVFLVQHHLARAQLPVVVELPKDGVPLLGMSDRIVLEDHRQSLALLIVPG